MNGTEMQNLLKHKILFILLVDSYLCRTRCLFLPVNPARFGLKKTAFPERFRFLRGYPKFQVHALRPGNKQDCERFVQSVTQKKQIFGNRRDRTMSSFQPTVYPSFKALRISIPLKFYGSIKAHLFRDCRIELVLLHINRQPLPKEKDPVRGPQIQWILFHQGNKH